MKEEGRVPEHNRQHDLSRLAAARWYRRSLPGRDLPRGHRRDRAERIYDGYPDVALDMIDPAPSTAVSNSSNTGPAYSTTHRLPRPDARTASRCTVPFVRSAAGCVGSPRGWIGE